MDINCDLGESLELLETGLDEALMPYLTSVNIACGFHAGDPYILRETVKNARKYGLKLGAHPGFDDKANFGRTDIELTPYEIYDLVQQQLQVFGEVVGGKFHHVKPHGALYNIAAARESYAGAIAQAVYDFDSSLVLYGLSDSLSISEAMKIGLNTYSEVFADRAYHANGTLVSRKTVGAVLYDLEVVKKQVSAFAKKEPIFSVEGTPLTLKADTICIHSDSPNAIALAQAVSSILSK